MENNSTFYIPQSALKRGFTPTPIMFFMYILKSKKDNNLYIGSTNDLTRRVTEHNTGLVFSTKHRIPLELIYYEAYRSEKDARIRERNLKLRARAFMQLKKRIKDSINYETKETI